MFKLTLITGLIFFVSCGSEGNKEKETINNSIPESIENSTTKIVLASEVEWTYLNPKRKDKAPMAGTLWGDRNGTEATGFLLKPNDGFESPPHIHNVSYRGIVISGLINNGDADADSMWMSTGSFWTQPKGDVHITSATGTNTIAYIEIEKGPYLVLPKEEAFDSGERPVNVEESNIVWLAAKDISLVEKDGAKISFLWAKSENNQLNGTLLKLPKGFNGNIYTKGATFGAVVIKGEPQFLGAENLLLETGSYLSSKGEAIHKISSLVEESILYIRTDAEYKVIQN